jgi:hypothetical protein
MIIVFWLDADKEIPEAKFKEFSEECLKDAMSFTEDLRRLKRDGASFFNITISAEFQNCTSKTGVDVPDKNYNWKKRRI